MRCTGPSVGVMEAAGEYRVMEAGWMLEEGADRKSLLRSPSLSLDDRENSSVAVFESYVL